MAGEVPDKLGRYELRSELGRGMMGVVYEALDPALGRTVALKTIRVTFALSEDERDQFEKRFLSEARLAAGLSHPNVVVVHDVGWDEATGTPYMALEFLRGRPLSEVVPPPLPWREALRISARLADALHHAHAQGIVHRDIKPANVMLLASGQPKIMDFGIARAPMSQLTAAGQFFGTPSYMSPEQANGDKIDGRSDLFSLGSVMYLLLTGQRAFDARSVPSILAKVEREHPARPSSWNPEIPADVDAIIARALAKQPSDRYQDGQQMLQDIEDALAGRPPRHLGIHEVPTLLTPAAARIDGEATGSGPAPVAAPASVAPVTPAAAEHRVAPVLPGATTARRVSPVILVAGAAAIVVAVVAGVAALLPAPPAATPEPAATPVAQAMEPPPATPTPEATPESRLAISPAPVAAARPSPPPAATPAPPPRPTPTATPTPPPATEAAAALLKLDVEHGVKEGKFRVLIDGQLALEKTISAREKKKAGIFRSREGTLIESLAIAVGARVIRIEVDEAGKPPRAAMTRGEFASGDELQLEVKVSGQISLKWR